MILNGLFFFVFWPTFKLGLINDPKSTQTEGSTNKRSCAAGVEARLLGLPLAMDKRVMSIDDREVQYCIMKRGMIIARQRRRSIVYIMWFVMIIGGHNRYPKLPQMEGSDNKHSCAAAAPGVEAELLSLPVCH